MNYKCELKRHKYVSSGYPCEGWLIKLSVWDGRKKSSLNALAKSGDGLVVSTASWFAEMYGDEDDSPEDVFPETTWSSIEVDEENVTSLVDELGNMGWTVVRRSR